MIGAWRGRRMSGKPASGLVHTRCQSIPLTEGVASVKVVPGTLMVQIRCHSISDTREREVTIPDQGKVLLLDALRHKDMSARS